MFVFLVENGVVVDVSYLGVVVAAETNLYNTGDGTKYVEWHVM